MDEPERSSKLEESIKSWKESKDINKPQVEQCSECGSYNVTISVDGAECNDCGHEFAPEK